MSSKILLVNPPFYRLLGSHYNANSLGIAYIAAYLNENGHDAWLYNADYLNQREYAALREIFDSFTDYTHFFKNENDPIWEEVSQKIIDWVEGKKTLVEAIEQDIPTFFVFGGDSMAHSMKGNIGLFISGGKDFYMDNISIEDIKNFSKYIGKLPDKVKVIYDKLTNIKSRVPNGLTNKGGKEYNTLITASENINFSKHKGGSTVINPPTLF